jgi:hypothetical protein
MKSSFIPLVCGLALVAMLAAGATHWWSVHQLVTGRTPADALRTATPAPAAHPTPIAAPQSAQVTAKPVTPVAIQPEPPAPRAESTVDPSQREFFTSLINELKEVRKQNQELHDQVAETNRDLMELQFRVDTHSESFRPLKVTSEPATLEGELNGVLPPKALPAE